MSIQMTCNSLVDSYSHPLGSSEVNGSVCLEHLVALPQILPVASRAYICWKTNTYYHAWDGNTGSWGIGREGLITLQGWKQRYICKE